MVTHADDCQSHIVDVRGRPDECTCGALISRDNDLLRRSDVIEMLIRLGANHADLAIYGEERNSRQREAMEAAFTHARCAVALMPAAEPLEAVADAALIAAAPEMYEALEAAWPANLLHVPDHLPDDFVFPVDVTAGELRVIRAALRKARGEV